MSKRKHWSPGNYVEIPVSKVRYCYGVVTITEKLAVMDYCDTQKLSAAQISDLQILFEVSAMKYGIGKNGWPIAGQLELTEKFKTKPFFFKKDIISGKYSIVDHNWMNEVSATKEECTNLEAAAAWDPCHIEARLNEHYKLH